MPTVPPATKLWVAGAVDLRLGFDGRADRGRSVPDADPMSGHLFVFTDRTADRVKVPCRGGRGLCPRCQRLEVGRHPSPPVADGRLGLAAAQFAMILDGFDPPTARRRGHPAVTDLRDGHSRPIRRQGRHPTCRRRPADTCPPGTGWAAHRAAAWPNWKPGSLPWEPRWRSCRATSTPS